MVLAVRTPKTNDDAVSKTSSRQAKVVVRVTADATFAGICKVRRFCLLARPSLLSEQRKFRARRASCVVRALGRPEDWPGVRFVGGLEVVCYIRRVILR